MPKLRILFFAALFLIPALALSADDLTGAGRLLCTSMTATACAEDGDCETDLPWAFKIPQFIELDLEARLLSTTQASDENRQSPITSLTRVKDLIVIQGLEEGRGYSILINEKNGRLSAAVARDGISVSVFGACTPVPVRK